MTYQERFLSLRLETRKLRQDCATYFRAWESQKEKSERLARENGELKKENKDLKERLGDTLEQLDREIEIKEKYRGMLFKSSKKENPVPKAGAEKKKRGGQIGHIELYKKTIVTKYNIQRQWCPDCKKEVRGIPQGTIENSPFGINILLWIMIQKYRLRLPLESISASLEIQYGLKIREGTIQKILHTLKKKFGSKYAELINEVRKNKIKYADETGWRIQGQNAWCWMFSSPDSVVYTIEETRGKGVPQRMLGNSPPGVLIRDDYAAYKKLDLPQQSCWSHLLRNSREKAERENSSKEVRDLHATLKAIFSELSEIIPQKMFAKKRKEVHQIYKKKIQVIIDTKYIAKDVQEIQTRITNQNTNLITAILYPGVPLTNNEAERNIRKMVVTRKISGGSRSDNGAATHAVNMSIIQTLALKKETLVSELQKLLNPAMVGLVLEKGE